MQIAKKVFSVENGFGMVVTKKGLEFGSKSVLHFEDVGDRSILCNLRWGFGGWGFWGLGFLAHISAQGSTK